MDNCHLCNPGKCDSEPLLVGIARQPLYAVAVAMARNTGEPLCACLASMGLISQAERADLMTVAHARRARGRREIASAAHMATAVAVRMSDALHAALLDHARAITALL